MGKSARIGLIDNNDSFTRNLEHLLAHCLPGGEIRITPYDRLGRYDPRENDLSVISPGPGEPADYPGYSRLLDSPGPVLGICLGMQIMNEHRGGRTARLPGCVHGKTEEIGFAGENFQVARYHSLYCREVGRGLKVLARNRDGAPMIMACESKKLLGYQFHPESFLTPRGDWFIRYAFDLFGLSFP